MCFPQETHMLRTEIMASLNFNTIYNVSFGLEDTHTLYCFFSYFLPWLHISGLLGKCQTNISMYCCSPIQGTRSWFLLKVGDKLVFPILSPGLENNNIFKCWSGNFPKTLRNIVILVNCRKTFKYMVVLQFRGADPIPCRSLMKPGSQS